MRQELVDLRKALNGQIDCQKTLAPFGTARPVNCDGRVVLLNGANAPILSPGNKLGRWTVSARCERIDGANGISVYATLPDGRGGFEADPLNPSLRFNEANPVSKVFRPAARPCATHFMTAVPYTACPSDRPVTTGLRFETKELQCEPQIPVPQSEYLRVVTSPNEACGHTHDPAYATCPEGWIASGCGYYLSRWEPRGNDYHSNAPDLSMVDSANRCVVIAGGRPGRGVCFKAHANCINLGRIANGR